MIVNQPDTKLFIDTDPAGLLIKGQRDFCRKWPNQQVVTRKARIFLWRHLLSKLARRLPDLSRKSLPGKLCKKCRKQEKLPERPHADRYNQTENPR